MRRHSFLSLLVVLSAILQGESRADDSGVIRSSASTIQSPPPNSAASEHEIRVFVESEPFGSGTRLIREATWDGFTLEEPVLSGELVVRGQEPTEELQFGLTVLRGIGLGFMSTLPGVVPLSGIRTDAGSLLEFAPGTDNESRTPIITAPVSEGRRLGQLAADGSYWFPARQDLDTMLSKIDSRLVRRIHSIPGPYSALYGPGFGFYDLERYDAPRYANGYESHGATVLEYVSNGQQWHGRQSLWGGSQNWGYRVGYGHRIGNDYDSGGPPSMPASYNSRIPDVALGANLTEFSRIDFHYLRVDQTDVEFPGQIFDMDFLVTDAYDLTYVHEQPLVGDQLEIEGWYNRTRFEGDNLRRGKRRQIPFFDNVPFGPGFTSRLDFTDVDAMSTGYSASVSWGCEECGKLTLGSDLRRLKQNLNEDSFIVIPFPGIPPAPLPSGSIPRARATNPGIFAETVLPITDCLTIKSGGRVDWVDMNADRPANPRFPFLVPADAARDFDLYSGYLTAERRVGCHWTAHLGGGYGMRPPTMTEMYADGPFVAVLPQLVFTQIVGNPTLRPGRMWQIDTGLSANYGRVRGGIHGYHAWVKDYITYDLLDDLLGGPIYNPVNTPLATLAGAELYGEYEFSSYVTGFGTFSYVEGRDRTRNQTIGNARALLGPATSRSGSLLAREPLAVIPPLNARAGIRVQDPGPCSLWAVEFAATIVDNQDRFAQTLVERATPGFTLFDLHAYARLTDSLLLTIGGTNLFDRFYQTHLDPHLTINGATGTPGNLPVYQPGASFYSGLEWTF